MKTAILASEDRYQAWLKRGGSSSEFARVQNSQSAADYDIFIDLNFEEHHYSINNYAGNLHTLFLLSSVTQTPEMVIGHAGLKYGGEKFFGINAIPGFLERSILEISNPFDLETSCISSAVLPFENFEWVKSSVGMVTPRIIFMIINEAFYTVEEGTAQENDIDTAMKLGTAYPRGPFEWLQLCGIDNVYKTLWILHQVTGDERYRISHSLYRKWLNAQINP